MATTFAAAKPPAQRPSDQYQICTGKRASEL